MISDNHLSSAIRIGLDSARTAKPTIRERVAVLYENHRGDIYRFLVGQGLEPAKAQELAQDVFVNLFVSLTKGTEISSERAWLYTVAG